VVASPPDDERTRTTAIPIGSVLQDIRFLLTGNQPSCVCPGEEYLSTIEAFDDKAIPVWPLGRVIPQIRLKPTRRTSGRLAAYQSKNIQDEHTSEIRRETLIKEFTCCWRSSLAGRHLLVPCSPAGGPGARR
jgi:hypothetical protein